MAKDRAAEHLKWGKLQVDGRRATYGVAGQGMPVLFIHGWALGSHAYKRVVKRFVRLGCRVYAPALPEFGGTPRLPSGASDLPGYAAWVAAFLDAAGVDEPVLVAGHSFGGAVAAQLAHDFPDRVAHLVLINAVGGGVWSAGAGRVRHLEERPLWHWAFHFTKDMATTAGALVALRSMLEDILPNLVLNPAGIWRVGTLARRARMDEELAGVRRSGVPVTVVASDGDLVIPRASFDALCRSLGVAGRVVPGRHSWLLAEPDALADVVAPAVAGAIAARAAAGRLEWRRAAG